MLTGIITQENTVVLSDDGYPIVESEKLQEVYYDCTVKSYGPDPYHWAVYYL